MASRQALEQALQNPNVRKFLDLLSYTEGTTGNGYLTAFGGGRLSSLADHPRYSKSFTQTNGKTNTTSAAGRYQFLKGTWDGLAKQYGFNDFGPKNQDLGAVALLAENGALKHILKGDWKNAVAKAGGTWASLPSSPHPQPTKSWQKVSAFLGGQINIPASGNSQAQQEDPRLAMSAPELIKALRKDKKMNDNELFVSLANGNGRAAQEINYLLDAGHSPDEIASQLGLKVKIAPQPHAQAQQEDTSLQITPEEMQILGIDTPDEQAQAQAPDVQPSAFTALNQPEQPEQPTTGIKDAIIAELPKLKEQGLSPYQAIYNLAQRDDDIGHSIKGAFGDGMKSEQIANYFGVNDIWQSQNEQSSNTLTQDVPKVSQMPLS